MEEHKIIELGRRAVACKAWRWLPGMLHMDMDDVLGCRVVGACEQGFTLWQGQGYGARGCTMHVPSISELPDLRDAATLGCLLQLVREAWNPHVTIICTEAGWAMRIRGGAVGLPELCAKSDASPWHASEAEALVVALEHAPAHVP